MHKVATGLAVLDHELTGIRLVVERQTGNLLTTPDNVLSEVICRHLEARKLSSANDLASLMRSSSADCESVIEELLDVQTGFFRHPAALKALTQTAIPELGKNKQQENPRPLRIWSAGCGTGEEAYSLAISVCEAVSCSDGVWKVQVVGSDLRRKALEAAERGLYPQDELASVPQSLLHRYFVKVGEHYLVKPRVRNLAVFSAINLANPEYVGRFDCIFCMDVLPHFSKAQRAALVQRLHLFLQPGGFLFLGQNEKIPATQSTFIAHGGSQYAFYQRPKAAGAAQG
jgi:two-component system CheB/CheR fusion protein